MAHIGYSSIEEFSETFDGVIDYLKYGQASEEILRIILKRERIRSLADLEDHLSRANHFKKAE